MFARVLCSRWRRALENIFFRGIINTMKHFQKESGNALFIILIAVALLGALSFAVTRWGAGKDTVSKEKTALAVDEMMDYANTLRTAVQRLMAVHGCTAGMLSFASNKFTDSAAYNNASAPADKSCHVFNAAGGGVTWQKPPAATVGAGLDALHVAGVEYLITGAMSVQGVGTTPSAPFCNTVNNSGQELAVMALVTRDMCLQINNAQGIVNTGGEPPVTGPAAYNIPGTSWWVFSGGFVANTTEGLQYCAQEVAGHSTGCWSDDGSANGGKHNYFFYSVLLAR